MGVLLETSSCFVPVLWVPYGGPFTKPVRHGYVPGLSRVGASARTSEIGFVEIFALCLY